MPSLSSMRSPSSSWLAALSPGVLRPRRGWLLAVTGVTHCGARLRADPPSFPRGCPRRPRRARERCSRNAAAVATILSDVVDPDWASTLWLSALSTASTSTPRPFAEMAMTSPDCPMADSIVRPHPGWRRPRMARAELRGRRRARMVYRDGRSERAAKVGHGSLEELPQA